ncbi:hypothetical protein [Streptomyces phaeochromogenes]|uniref:hypothetical protein n=1 Tax=Streptomyces phaeochromogenes TaxID=1923 RepID=UPI0036B435D4
MTGPDPDQNPGPDEARSEKDTPPDSSAEREHDPYGTDDVQRLRSVLEHDVRRFNSSGSSGSVYFDEQVRAESLVGRDQFIINLNDSAATRPSWRRFSDRETAELDAVFVPPSGAAEAQRQLRRQRVLVVYGPGRTGKHFYARALAAAVTSTGGECRLLAPGTDPDALSSDDIARDCAYVIAAGTTYVPSAFHLSRISRLLAERHAHLVIVVDASFQVFEELREWMVEQKVTGDRREMLLRHLQLRLSTRQLAKEPRRAEDLVALPELADWLASEPSPAEIAHAARALVQGLDDGRSVADCLAQVGARAADDARALLGRTEASWELATAIAFFGGLAYSTVLGLEDSLADLTHEAAGHDKPRSRSFLTVTRSQRLDLVLASTVSSVVATPYGSSPAETVDFIGAGLADALIDVLWKEYDTPALLLRWLSGLARHPVEAVRRRAAVSLGRLSLLDFTQIAEGVLQEWALSPDPRDRWAAALAVSVAVRDPVVAPHAMGLVESWGTGGNRYRRMTAALAWGVGISPLQPVVGLRGLRRLLRTNDPGLYSAVQAGLVTTFTGGLEPLVLDAIGTWLPDTTDDARDNLLAVFLRLCLVRGAKGRPDANSWPTVLWMFDRSLGHGDSRDTSRTASARRTHDDITDLWRAALDARATRPTALRVLTTWIRWADERGEFREALLDLLDFLAEGETAVRRLEHHIGRLAQDRKRPSHTAGEAWRELSALLEK